jgi:hypothetical protein
MGETSGASNLHTLDTVSENIFGGISVVRCYTNRDEMKIINENKDTLQCKLENFCSQQRLSMNNPSLQQMLPSGGQEDFFWLGQSCEFSGTMKIKEAIIDNHRRDGVFFYDAYSIFSNPSEDNQFNEDSHMKDGCVWNAVLSGSIGIFMKQVFFDCTEWRRCVGSLIV